MTATLYNDYRPSAPQGRNNVHLGFPICLVTFLLTLSLPLSARAAAARVEFVSGDAQVTSGTATPHPLTRGSEVDAADTIDTRSGRVQLRFTDGGYVALAPNTQFRVDRYRYDGSNNGKEVGFFSLLKGSLRTISGLIGKGRREAYQMNTPTATIGIRGTAYSADQRGENLQVTVSEGRVVVNQGGKEYDVSAGQSGLFTGNGNPPKIGAAGSQNGGGNDNNNLPGAAPPPDTPPTLTPSAPTPPPPPTRDTSPPPTNSIYGPLR